VLMEISREIDQRLEQGGANVRKAAKSRAILTP